MILTSLMESADRGELLLVDGGLCRWHRHKRENIVVIRELLVLTGVRRQGVGRRLVKMVCDMNPDCPVLARCPAWYESNAFWRALGFTLGKCVKGVNEWHLGCATVPTAT